jgi:hypothetical protein
MAFTVTARHSANSVATAIAAQATDSVAPSADSLLLIFAGAQRDQHTTSETWSASGGSLTWTQTAVTSAFPWDTSADFSISAALHRAVIGGSPSAFAITCDAWADASEGFYAIVGCDVTGHNAASPIVQSATNGAALTGGDAHSGSVTLGTTPVVGNLVVVSFSSSADDDGGFATPTFGGRAMTQLFNQATLWTQSSLWFLVVDGTETDDTITCADLGQQVGNYAAIAIEIEEAPGDVAAETTLTAVAGITAEPVLTAESTATIAAVAAVTAEASIPGVVDAEAAITVTAAITPGATVTPGGTPGVAVEADITAEAEVQTPQSVDAEATVTVTAAITAGAAITRAVQASVSAVATISATVGSGEEALIIRSISGIFGNPGPVVTGIAKKATPLLNGTAFSHKVTGVRAFSVVVTGVAAPTTVVTGVRGVQDEQMSGPRVGRVVTGPKTSRVVTGPKV